jgi:hypothetical protein
MSRKTQVVVLTVAVIAGAVGLGLTFTTLHNAMQVVASAVWGN